MERSTLIANIAPLLSLLLLPANWHEYGGCILARARACSINPVTDLHWVLSSLGCWTERGVVLRLAGPEQNYPRACTCSTPAVCLLEKAGTVSSLGGALSADAWERSSAVVCLCFEGDPCFASRSDHRRPLPMASRSTSCWDSIFDDSLHLACLRIWFFAHHRLHAPLQLNDIADCFLHHVTSLQFGFLRTCFLCTIFDLQRP